MLRERTCLRVQACAEGRLSATGLVAGEVHADAEAAENADDCLASLRVERIDETCHEELDASHTLILSHCHMSLRAERSNLLMRMV